VTIGEHGANPFGIVAEEVTAEHSFSFGEDYSNPEGLGVPRMRRFVPVHAADEIFDSQLRRQKHHRIIAFSDLQGRFALAMTGGSADCIAMWQEVPR